MAVNLDMTVPIRQTAQRECVDMSRTEIGTLFITAEPEDQVSVGNTRELKAIQTVMDVGPLAFRKENVYHATRMGVMEGLDRHRPQLVHFHAHGTLEGVFLEGPDGTATRITAQWLVTAFATYPSTRLVVLNTCTSVALAKALVQSPDTGVLGAVAWQNRVMAQDACAFVAAFYKRLASLDSVETAFKFACAAVEDHVAANAVLHLANADFSLIAGVESVTPISNPLPLVHTPSPVLSDSTLANPGFIPADVAILIALEEEWEVFWRIAGEPVGIKDDSGGYLYHFDVPCVTGRPYRCVALFMGAMGPGQATHATTRLLTARPRTLVNLGIAAAIHDDLKLCDVVVAEQVDDYLATVKAVAKGKNGWAFELRGSVYKTTHALVQDLINLKFSHPDAFTRWRSVCAPAKAERADQLGTALEAKHLREAPKITKVHLASGPVLAAAQAFSKWLGTRDGLLKALEMEAAGMMLTAHQQADPARTLVLRGISDFGDERKSQTDRESGGAFRHLAMFNATQLLWAMLHQGLLPRHEPIAVPPRKPAGREPRIGPSTSPDHAGLGVPHDPEVDPPWTDAERQQIEKILTTALRDAPALSRSLETRLALRRAAPVGPLPDDIHARVARRIVSLGKGCSAALALAEDCCKAVFGDRAEARGEQREARKLLEQWLPLGYRDEARVVLLTLSGPSSPTAARPDARHIEVATLSPFIAEVHVAGLNGRPAAFTTRNALVDGQRRRLVEGRARFPTRSVGSEILTGDGIARAIVRSAYKRYLLEPTTSDAMAMLNVITELETQMELTGLRHYVVFTGKERCDELFAAVILRLGELFPELQVVALGEVPGTTDAIPEHIRQETKLLTYLRRIFEDHGIDDDDI